MHWYAPMEQNKEKPNEFQGENRIQLGKEVPYDNSQISVQPNFEMSNVSQGLDKDSDLKFSNDIHEPLEV